MNHYYIFQIFFLLLLLITLTRGRTLYYDELNEEDKRKLFSTEYEDLSDLESKLSDVVNDDNNNDNDDDDDRTYDSYEEKQFHQRSLFSTSRASHTISPHTRQAILDILQKAFDEGWRPSLKHYIPATRFGRHRR